MAVLYDDRDLAIAADAVDVPHRVLDLDHKVVNKHEALCARPLVSNEEEDSTVVQIWQ